MKSDATRASWFYCYKALQDGLAGVGVPIDKRSILVTVVFSYIVFHERLSGKAAAGLLSIVAGTLIMLILSNEAGGNAMHFELSILNYIQSHLHSGFLDTAMPLVTTLGNKGAIWIGCAALLLLIPKTRKAGAAMAASLVLETLCCNVILKPLTGRIRPCDVNAAVRLLITHPTDFSFPSGHTGASFAAVSALYFSKNRLWIPTLVLAMLIAFSRLYLYVHYPSDVFAGMLIGIMAGWFGSALTDFMERKRHERSSSDS